MLATTAFAQTQASTGQIAGEVKDSSGAVVPNATVHVTNADIGVDRTVTSNDAGLYRVVLLPAGNYQVTVDAQGFAQAKVNSVTIEVGRTVSLDLRLAVGKVAESVEVTTEGVQVARSEPDALLNQAAIDNLPINGRRFQDFATLTPGAQVDPSRSQISLSGQRGIYGANVNIDGLDYNQPFFGGIRGGERSNFAATIPQESIREFQVVASGYSAEFGRSTGGVLTAVTKSGTNSLHGSAFYLHRDQNLARSNQFFDTVSIARGLPVNPAPTQQQWGGSIGGPVMKDKVFFFGSYEGQRFRNNRQVLFPNVGGSFTPTAANMEAYNFYKSLEEPFLQTNDSHIFLVKTDWQMKPNHRLNIRYNYSWNEGLNSTSQGATTFDPTINNALSNNGTEKDSTHTIVGQLASVFGANIANEFRGQWTREERPREANFLEPTVHSAIGRFGTVNFLPTVQFDWRAQFADNVTWTKGKHTWKFGGEYNRLLVDQTFAFNQFGLFNFTTSTTATILNILSLGSGGAGDPANRFDSTSVTYTRQIGNGLLAFNQDQLGFFIQDAWRIRPNLTLNYGLRWDGTINPTPDATNTGLVTTVMSGVYPSGDTPDPTKIEDQLNQWGPRVGFAWDPWSDSKTVVRGFAGIYYANTPALLYAGPMNNFRATPGDLSIQLPLALPVGFSSAACPTVASCDTIFEQLRLIGVDLNTVTLDNLPIISASDVQSIAGIIGLPNFNPFTGAQPILMGNDFHNPRALQFGLGVERDFGHGLTVGLDLSEINTSYLQRNRDVNLPLAAGTDAAGRPLYNVTSGAGQQPRPVSTLGSLQVRESSARSLYRAATLRANWKHKKAQLNAYYTLSQNLSSDDNERDAGGVTYDDMFNLAPEYSYARIDAKHQFVVNPVINLPWAIDVASAIRLRSGRPVDARVGSDLNRDGNNLERPYSAIGVPFKRNAFRNHAVNTVDLRIQKNLRFKENVRVALSAEFFNLFNWMNIQLDGSTVVNYCGTTSATCGLSGSPTNINFLQIRDQRPGSNLGKLLTNNQPGSPFQAQFGVRFSF